MRFCGRLGLCLGGGTEVIVVWLCRGRSTTFEESLREVHSILTFRRLEITRNVGV